MTERRRKLQKNETQQPEHVESPFKHQNAQQDERCTALGKPSALLTSFPEFHVDVSARKIPAGGNPAKCCTSRARD